MSLKFGTFMAPFHCPVGQDPTAAYERDLDVIRHMDTLGFDEAWIGEHHSCGHELIPDPFIFIAWAASQTRHIKLGTGVVSLPYHNPLWVADRYGLDAFAEYTQNVIAAPHFRAAGQTFTERVAWVNETGLGVIGTPGEAVAQIERLERQSGGFGSYLLMHHEWARHDATLRSYELFASHVKPRFQRATGRLEKSRDYGISRWAELDQRHGAAIAAAAERHARERAERH